jgi:Phospholipase_D-nuclease N-terminal
MLLVTLIGIVLLLIWALVLVDIVRRRDLGTGSKVLWALLVFILPIVGAIIYLVARPAQPGDIDLPSETQGSEGFEPMRHGPG